MARSRVAGAGAAPFRLANMQKKVSGVDMLANLRLHYNFDSTTNESPEFGSGPTINQVGAVPRVAGPVTGYSREGDGTTLYMASTGDISALHLSPEGADFTLSFYFYPDTFASAKTDIILLGTTYTVPATLGWGFRLIPTTGVPTFYYSTSAVAYDSLADTENIPTIGAWNHVLIYRIGGNLYMSINGADPVSKAVTNIIVGASVTTLYIFAGKDYCDGRFCRMSIYDVGIAYNSPLAAALRTNGGLII